MTTPRALHRLALALLLLPLAACAAHQQAVRFEGDADRDAVLAVVERSFEAIAAKGPESEALWREVLLDRGAMSSVREVDGERRVHVMDYGEHFERFADEPDPRPYLERLWEPVVLIDGDIATVWARYDFWLDEQFSHGGTDVVVLLRTDDGWKIASFAWSVETEATDTPLGPPDFDDDEHGDDEDDD